MTLSYGKYLNTKRTIPYPVSSWLKLINHDTFGSIYLLSLIRSDGRQKADKAKTPPHFLYRIIESTLAENNEFKPRREMAKSAMDLRGK
jgi:hypothetical protein